MIMNLQAQTVPQHHAVDRIILEVIRHGIVSITGQIDANIAAQPARLCIRGNGRTGLRPYEPGFAKSRPTDLIDESLLTLAAARDNLRLLFPDQFFTYRAATSGGHYDLPTGQSE